MQQVTVRRVNLGHLKAGSDSAFCADAKCLDDLRNAVRLQCVRVRIGVGECDVRWRHHVFPSTVSR